MKTLKITIRSGAGELNFVCSRYIKEVLNKATTCDKVLQELALTNTFILTNDALDPVFYGLPPVELQEIQGAFENGSEFFSKFYNNRELPFNFKPISVTTKNGDVWFNTLNEFNRIIDYDQRELLTMEITINQGETLERTFTTFVQESTSNNMAAGNAVFVEYNHGLFFVNEWIVQDFTNEVVIESDYDNLPTIIIVNDENVAGLINTETRSQFYTTVAYPTVTLDALKYTATSNDGEDLVANFEFLGSFIRLQRGTNTIVTTDKNAATDFTIAYPQTYRGLF